MTELKVFSITNQQTETPKKVDRPTTLSANVSYLAKYLRTSCLTISGTSLPRTPRWWMLSVTTAIAEAIVTRHIDTP